MREMNCPICTSATTVKRTTRVVAIYRGFKAQVIRERACTRCPWRGKSVETILDTSPWANLKKNGAPVGV
jgi:C4-type Zn-finger protein